MRGPAGAIVKHVATQCQDQGRLLEEAKRDLEVFKNAYYKAVHENRDNEAKLEQLTHQLRVRVSPYTQREVVDGHSKSPPSRFHFVYDDAVMPIVPSSIQAIEAREKRVVVLIDGDGAIFLPSLIAGGKEGGHEAASRLTEKIQAHLAPHQFQLHVYVFHNRRGLMNTLKRCGHNAAAAAFDDFVVGFNQAAERFAMIDAGELKEGSDHKIRGVSPAPARPDRK